MFRYVSLFIILICFSGQSLAQDKYKDFKWRKTKPSNSTIPEEWLGEDAVCVRNYRNISFSIVDLRNWRTTTTETVIRRIKILTEEGLEKYSKIYLWKRDKDRIEVLDARTIKPNGKVIDMKAEEIKKLDLSSSDLSITVDQIRFAIPNVEVGDEVEYIYKVKSDQLRYSDELYVHSYLPTISSELRLKVPMELQLDILGYNDISQYTVEEGTQSNIIKWKMNLLEAIGDDELAMAWKQLPYATYVIRNVFTDMANGGKKHKLVENEWKELYHAYDRVYDDAGLQRSDHGVFKDYVAQVIAKCGSENKLVQLSHLIDSYVNDLDVVWLSDEESNNTLGYFLTRGKIDERNYHILMRRTFRALDLDFSVGFARNKYDGAIDPNILAPGFVTDVLYAIESSPGKYRFVFPCERRAEYRMDELPFYIYGAEVFLINARSFGANNVTVKKVKMKETKSVASRTKTRSVFEIEGGEVSSCSVERSATGISAPELRHNYEGIADNDDYLEKAILRDTTNYVAYQYETKAELSVNEIESGLISIPLSDLLTHQFRYVEQEEERALDYYPMMAQDESFEVQLSLEAPYEIVNKADLETKVEEGTSLYELKLVDNKEESKVMLVSRLVESGDPVPAAQFNENTKRSQEIMELMDADLILRRID